MKYEGQKQHMCFTTFYLRCTVPTAFTEREAVPIDRAFMHIFY